MKLEFLIGLSNFVLSQVQIERIHSSLFVEEAPTIISYNFINQSPEDGVEVQLYDKFSREFLFTVKESELNVI